MSRSDIMILGRELDATGQPTTPVGIPKPVWDRHLLICGETGTGKTTTATTALATAHRHTDGPTIVVDPKGAGWLREVARAQYAQTGTLENVLYFDASACVPAMSVFDIRRQLAAGVSRPRAIKNITEHFLSLVDHVKPADFQAIRSPDIIRYLIRALFDEVHGRDAFPLTDLLEAVMRLQTEETPPSVSDPTVATLLENITTGRQSTVEQTIDGAVTRLEKFQANPYLHPLFNYVPTDPDDQFHFGDWLETDALLLFDLGGPHERTQRILANLILARLWRALRTRKQHTAGEPPLALLCLDELPQLGVDALLSQFLATGREYGLGVITLCQSPAQLATAGTTQANANTDAHGELLNNSQSILSGAVSDEAGLASTFSGSHMSEAEVSNRLTNMPPARWLFQPAAQRGQETPRSFVIGDPPLPPGHPEGQAPLTDEAQAAFATAFSECRQTTAEANGLVFESATAADEKASTADGASAPAGRLSPFALTDRLPACLAYSADRHALQCESCGRYYEPTRDGVKRAIQCCHTLSDIDREAIPICSLPLKRSPAAIATASWSRRQFAFLQAVATAQQRRYDPHLEFDIVHDSMIRLREYVGIRPEAVTALVEAGLLRHDGDHPHRLYSITSEGRDLLDERYREGIHFGHGTGDLTESSLHVLMVEAGRRYLETTYAADPESPVTEVIPYYELDETDTTASDAPSSSLAAAMGNEPTAIETASDHAEARRLDIAGVDAAGEVVVAAEAERPHNDAPRAIPADFDAMAACGVDEAIWIVPKRAAASTVLNALREPAEGPPRTDKSYDANTPARQFQLAEPGLTAMYTVSHLQKQLPTPATPSGSSV